MPCQNLGSEKRDDVFQQLLRLQHASVAGFTASLKSGPHTQHGGAIGSQLFEVAQRGRMSIHFAVHGRRNQQGHGFQRPGKAHQAQQIVSPALHQFGHEVGAQRRQ